MIGAPRTAPSGKAGRLLYCLRANRPLSPPLQLQLSLRSADRLALPDRPKATMTFQLRVTVQRRSSRRSCQPGDFSALFLPMR